MRYTSTGLRLAAAVLCTSIAHAQVQALFTPVPPQVTQTLGIRGVGAWTVRVCNQSPERVTIPEERFYLAAPQLLLLDKRAIVMLLTVQHGHNPKVRIARYVETAIALTSVFAAGGLFTASVKTIVALSLGATAAHQLADILQGEVPNLAPLEPLLVDGSITLEPGACATRFTFGAVQKAPQPLVVDVPAR